MDTKTIIVTIVCAVLGSSALTAPPTGADVKHPPRTASVPQSFSPVT